MTRLPGGTSSNLTSGWTASQHPSLLQHQLRLYQIDTPSHYTNGNLALIVGAYSTSHPIVTRLPSPFVVLDRILFPDVSPIPHPQPEVTSVSQHLLSLSVYPISLLELQCYRRMFIFRMSICTLMRGLRRSTLS